MSSRGEIVRCEGHTSGHSTSCRQVECMHSRRVEPRMSFCPGQLETLVECKATRARLSGALRTARAKAGGQGGIRTLERLLTVTHFPGVRLQPLGHLSVCGEMSPPSKGRGL